MILKQTYKQMIHYVLSLCFCQLQLLGQCLLVVMAMYFPQEFTPEVHVSVDKFLLNLGNALSEKYR